MSKPFGNDKDQDKKTSPGGGQTTGGSKILGSLIGDQQHPVGGKSKVPAYLTNDLLERLRNTVVGLQRDPEVEEPPVSLSSFVEDAVQRAIEQAEEEHNNSRPYARRPNRNLKTGPPISS